MSFDVIAQAFRDGDAATGDVAAARDILSKVPHTHDAEFDFYSVQLADGAHLEMYAGGLDGKKPFEGAMFALRGLSDAMAVFMFEFARAAGLVLLPAMSPACILLTDDSQSRHLPADMSDEFQVMTIASGGELSAALQGGYDTWRAFRDQVVGGADGGLAGR